MGKGAVNVAVCGAAGRMGRAVVASVHAHPGMRVSGAVDVGEAVGKDVCRLAGIDFEPISITDNSDDGLAAADVVIDFSSPASTENIIALCTERKLPLVVGTTGLAESASAKLVSLSQSAPVVVASNFSEGVTVLLHLAEVAAALLNDGFDAEIVEMHHRHKVDAPSGTALSIAEVVARARGVGPEARVSGRDGRVGERSREEIGVMSLRGGGVIGDHTLVLASEGERVEITHRAHDRSIFARGAVRAARWLVEQPPGRYDMFDVMGIAPQLTKHAR